MVNEFETSPFGQWCVWSGHFGTFWDILRYFWTIRKTFWRVWSPISKTEVLSWWMGFLPEADKPVVFWEMQNCGQTTTLSLPNPRVHLTFKAMDSLFQTGVAAGCDASNFYPAPSPLRSSSTNSPPHRQRPSKHGPNSSPPSYIA